jgi:rhodanese-related sulfurtransferase
LELAYAPPYGSAKDPVNMAGYVAANDLKGDIDIIHATELEDLDPNAITILDVRTKKEYEKGRIKGSKHIHLDELRERLDEIPRKMPVITYCATGLRSYYAYRILKQKGFKVLNLSGGIENYMAVKEIKE